MELREGPLYEKQLEKFLSENPSKTKEDFPFAFISFTNRVIFIPSIHVPVFKFRCPVLSVFKTSFLDHVIYKLYVPLVGEGDDAVYCNLYVSEHLLNGYIPHEGDDIEGVLWMNGHIARSATKERKGA